MTRSQGISTPPVIRVLFDRRKEQPAGVVCCAGYQSGKWRKARLAKHLLEWLPDYVLTPEEKAALDPINAYRTLEMAARRFFAPDVAGERGELGELLIHLICVQEFRTRQFVARLFYKMRSNDQITGFDIVHVRYDEQDEKIELWLGEAKLHSVFSDGVTAAIKTLKDHLDEGFLEESKALIGPKIPTNDRLYDKLSWLFDANVSLDELVDRLVVPVFVGSNCEVSGAIGDLPDNYEADCQARLATMQRRLDKKYGKDLVIVSIYFPLNDKDGLTDEFESRLGALV